MQPTREISEHLNKSNDDWTKLLKELKDVELNDEMREYDIDGVMDGEEGLIQVILDANDSVARLQVFALGGFEHDRLEWRLGPLKRHKPRCNLTNSKQLF